MKNDSHLCSIELVRIINTPFHIFNDLGILYVVEGDLNMTVVSGSNTLSPGNIEIINKKEPVMFEGINGPCKILLLRFSSLLEDILGENFESRTFNCQINNFFEAKALEEDIQQLKRKFLNLSFALANSDSQKSRELIEDESFDTIKFILNNLDDIGFNFYEKSFHNSDEERFKRISEYMVEHITEKITLNEIAKSEYLSVQYLSKEFSHKLSKNFQSILNYYRVINCVILLLETDYSLTRISEISGFSSVRYLNSIFKEHLSCLPSEFRKVHKNKKHNSWVEKEDLLPLLEEIKVNIEKTNPATIFHDVYFSGLDEIKFKKQSLPKINREETIRIHLSDYKNALLIIETKSSMYKTLCENLGKLPPELKARLSPSQVHIKVEENYQLIETIQTPGDIISLYIVNDYF